MPEPRADCGAETCSRPWEVYELLPSLHVARVCRACVDDGNAASPLPILSTDEYPAHD